MKTSEAIEAADLNIGRLIDADTAGDLPQADETGHMRNRRILTPAEVIAPGVCPPADEAISIDSAVARRRQRWARSSAGRVVTPEQLLRRSIVRVSSAADNALPVPRPGSLDALQWPSRIGNRLHYRDGRVTDMDSNELQGPRP